MRRLAEEEFARQFINETRSEAPGLGGTKLWEIYVREFGEAQAFLANHGVDTSHTIYHTDRGVQYASYDYVEQLRLY